MSPLFRLLLIVAVIGMAVMVSPSALGSDWGKVSDEEWQTGRPIDFPDANAVVLFSRCSLLVSITGITMDCHVRMKVFNKTGATDIGDVEIPYYDGDKFKVLKAQTITPDGKTLKVEGRDMFEKKAGHIKVKSFSFPALDSGCVAEYRYSCYHKRYALLDPWYFQGAIYALQSQFTLILAPGFTYSSIFSKPNGGSSEAVEGTLSNMDDPRRPLKTFTWTQRNLPPITSEPYMGAREDYCSSLHYQLVSYSDAGYHTSFAKDWLALGEYLQDFVDDYASGGAIDKLLARLVTPDSTNGEKIRRIYDWVSDSIQTKDDPNNEWFTNESIGQLLKNGFGTGAEKNMLLVKMAGKAGMTARPVFISTRGHRQIDSRLSQLEQFNYMLSYVEIDSASAMILDGGAKYCPYSMLPAECLVDAGFLIDGKKSRLIRIGRADPRTYRLDATDMVIDSVGGASCTTTSTFTGYFGPQYGEYSDRSTPDEFLREYFLDKVDEQAIIDSQHLATDSLNRFIVYAAYKMDGYARRLDSNLVVKPPYFHLTRNPFKRERRSFPVDFNFPFTYHSVVRISTTGKLTTASLPHDTAFSIEGASFVRSSQMLDEVAVVSSKLTISVPVFEPTRYSELRKLFEQIVQSESDEAILTCE